MMPPLAHPRPSAQGHPNGVQLGGLGTGRIELGREGRLSLAAITNNWQRLLADLEGAFFGLRVEDPDFPGAPRFRLLQAQGLDGFPGSRVAYSGTHPAAEVEYAGAADDGVDVRLTAFGPLVPHDPAASSTPGSVFIFRIHNTTDRTLRVDLSFSWEHLIGCGGTGRRGLALQSDRTGNIIEPWRGECGDGGLLFTGENPSRNERTSGEMVLATQPPRGAEIHLLQFWNILSDRPAVLAALAAGERPPSFDGGPLAMREAATQARKAAPPSWDDPDPRFGGAREGLEGAIHPAGTVIVSLTVEPRAEAEIPFSLAWRVPALTALDQPGIDHSHFHAKLHPTAGSAAETLLRDPQALLERVRAPHRHIRGGSLPDWLANKVLNDHTAVTTNSIVTAKGDLYTLEASPMMFGALGTLDQRLVAHPGYSLFFPDLNRTELRTFARLQAEDGSLPHFNGNAHTAFGSAAVEYGETGWPDLACSFIIQCFRDWRETGEAAFIGEMQPHIDRAADWLLAADRDGDGVPEGGSSWDIEHYPGCFIATATVWMATLRILQTLAEAKADRLAAARFAECRHRAAATVESMWRGTHYLKCLDTTTGQASDDVFLGQLAGEWVVRSLGLPGVLPPARVRTVLQTLYRLAGDRNRYRLMPIQTRPDGSLPDRKYAWHAWPQYGLVFVDCLAFLAGLPAEALSSVEAFDHVVREVNRTPWATTLWHDARDGRPDFGSFMGLDWYMNTPASWWLLGALSGFAMDEPGGVLTVGPPPPFAANAEGARVLPVVTPRFWATVRWEADGFLVFHLERVFRGETVVVSTVRLRDPAADDLDGLYREIPLENPLSLQAGGSLRVHTGEERQTGMSVSLS
ncbi:MAG: hypothetical protein JJT96_11065 [Opitutales bacterium]|nr:hypothetical protein [Opitutales bacterium]